MTTCPDRSQDFAHHRPHLLAVAFRILGSDADAQDVVQEAWIRYTRAAPEDLRNPAAWLTTVVTRLCLDLLRRRREDPQAPSEVAGAPGAPDNPVAPAGAESPEEVALLAGELAEAFMVVLQRLTPPQRVALVLHDAFGTPFEDVAHILGTTPGSAKKLASRARGLLRQATDVPQVDPAHARRVVERFLGAARRGDLDGLVAVLHPEVTRTADPQALPPDAAPHVRGAEAVAAETRALRANARRAALVTIDGRPGIAVRSDDGRARIALVFVVAGDRILHYDVIADPQRLAVLHVED